MKAKPQPRSEDIKGKHGVFSTELFCNVVRIDCRPDAMHFYFPTGDCCDMAGAIKIAQLIHPNVKCIFTYSGDKQDTAYVKYAKHRKPAWKAIPHHAFQA